MDFSFFFQNDFKISLPEVFLSTAILILTLHSTIIVTFRGVLLNNSLKILSILTLSSVFYLLINDKIIFSNFFSNLFISDDLSLIIKLFITFFTISCFFIFDDFLYLLRVNRFEYFILILCTLFSLMLLVSSYDLISLYLAIEMQSFCLYVLAAFKKNSSFSTEAGIKYFIIGSFSSCLLLFGISLVYFSLGTTNYLNFQLIVSEVFYTNTFLQVNSFLFSSLFLILFAFLFKISSAPFHIWIGDIYEGSPSSSTAFFAIVPKIALFTALLRFFYALNLFDFLFEFVLILCSSFSIFFGTFLSLKQRRLKRFFAFSSVSHVGYILLACSFSSIESIESTFFYILCYSVTVLSLWIVFFALQTSVNVGKSKEIADLSLFSFKNPSIAFSLLLSLFSLAGIPPLAGFLAKINIFINVFDGSLYFFCFFIILVSVISAFYYLRLIKILYFEKNSLNFFLLPMSYSSSLVLSFCNFILIFFFLNPSVLYLISQKMSLCLFS